LERARVKKVFLLTGEFISDRQLDKLQEEEFGEFEVNGTKLLMLSKADFIRIRSKSTPTSGFGIAIFFIQTLALIAKDAGGFGFANALNLDAEQATGTCVSPLDYNTRFICKMVVLPIVMFSFIPLAVPSWNKLRKVIPSQVAEKLKLPMEIERVHFKRSLINVYLFIFAPLTRDAVQSLVCVGTCADETDPACKKVLAFDMSVRCYEGAHLITGFVAVGVLGFVVVLIPMVLIYEVQKARNKRSAALDLQASNSEGKFDLIAVEKDGVKIINREQTKELLKLLGERMNTRSLEKAFFELDSDHDNEISFEEFDIWYKVKCAQVELSAYDVLFGPYTQKCSWWFVWVLWLKTAINVLFTFGYFGDFSWHLWVHLCLAGSMCLVVVLEPHATFEDRTIELFALLCLAAVTHVASIFKSGEQWTTDYLFALGALSMLPLLVTAFVTVKLKRQANQEKSEAKRIRDGTADELKAESAVPRWLEKRYRELQETLSKTLSRAEDVVDDTMEKMDKKLDFIFSDGSTKTEDTSPMDVPKPPLGWQVCWSYSKSTYYYFNPETKQSEWVVPSRAQLRSPPLPDHPLRDIESNSTSPPSIKAIADKIETDGRIADACRDIMTKVMDTQASSDTGAAQSSPSIAARTGAPERGKAPPYVSTLAEQHSGGSTFNNASPCHCQEGVNGALYNSTKGRRGDTTSKALSGRQRKKIP
jgi:hypothetical protein